VEDWQLISRFNRGDASALRSIYHEYRDDLLKVAAALLDDRHAVEDVIHDVFVSFAGKAGRFTLRGSLKGYLSICVANRARDRNRQWRRRHQVLDEASAIPGVCVGPEVVAARREEFQAIWEALRRLPSEQREVIVLHLGNRLKFRQIAAWREESVNTIQSRYRYGLEKLRCLLDGHIGQ
jgi:RNA polymerase sigma-70 factor (ECF subfamily)